MTPRTAARAIIAAGWLAGMSLILAGLPTPDCRRDPGRGGVCRHRVDPLGCPAARMAGGNLDGPAPPAEAAQGGECP